MRIGTLATAGILALGAGLAASAAAQTGGAQHGGEPVIAPAADGIFAAFDTHPLVGLGELHNLNQAFLFYEALIRDPRFASEVGNLVVEFGGAAQQDTIDRYVNGEDVPYEALRRVWTDVVGWQPTVLSAYYPHVFFQVRQTNMSLPEDRRIKVWLGEPAIDWTLIETREQWDETLQQRETSAAQVIEDNILARGEKALVIYGGAHFERLYPEEKAAYAEWMQTDPRAAQAMIDEWELMKIVEDRHPGAMFTAQMYAGFENAACTAELDRAIAEWGRPMLALHVKDTTLGEALRACMGPFPEERVAAFRAQLPASMPPALLDYFMPSHDRHQLFEADAVLFLAPASELTQAPVMADIYLDEDFRREISRRREIMQGEPLPEDFGRYLPESMAFTTRFR